MIVETAPATPDRSEAIAPVAADRLASLDFIRGIAVMGILAANIVAFGQPFAAYMYPDAFTTGHGPAEDWMWVVQFVLIDGKMRGLFTLLFGAGMYLFMEKAWAKGASRWLQARRLFWLLLFGLFHFYFIWRGDILVAYSICGFLALACLRWAAKTQLVVGLIGFFLGALFFLGAMGMPYFVSETSFGERPEMTDTRANIDDEREHELADGKAELEIIGEEPYPSFVRHNFEVHGGDPFAMASLFLLETLPLMLIGMALYRFGLFSGGMNPARQRLWGWIGLLAGGVTTLLLGLWALGNGLTYWGTLAAFLGFSPLPRLPMVLGLAALLALYGVHAKGWLGERVSAAGRMAFSNYLGTSILMLFVFHGWALGMHGELTRTGLYVVVLAAWIVMLAWSKPWLARFRYGPLEWLWRCLTYGRVFALKR